jgi:hypothetical protein
VVNDRDVHGKEIEVAKKKKTITVKFLFESDPEIKELEITVEDTVRSVVDRIAIKDHKITDFEGTKFSEQNHLFAHFSAENAQPAGIVKEPSISAEDSRFLAMDSVISHWRFGLRSLVFISGQQRLTNTSVKVSMRSVVSRVYLRILRAGGAFWRELKSEWKPQARSIDVFQSQTTLQR